MYSDQWNPKKERANSGQSQNNIGHNGRKKCAIYSYKTHASHILAFVYNFRQQSIVSIPHWTKHWIINCVCTQSKSEWIVVTHFGWKLVFVRVYCFGSYFSWRDVLYIEGFVAIEAGLKLELNTKKEMNSWWQCFISYNTFIINTPESNTCTFTPTFKHTPEKNS